MVALQSDLQFEVTSVTNIGRAVAWARAPRSRMSLCKMTVNEKMTPAVSTAEPEGDGCHTFDAKTTVARFEVDPARGLSSGEARARLQRYGENRLAEKPPRSRWLAFADQFRSVLIIVLIAAAVLAGAIGDVKDAAVILVVVLLNALLGFWQEYRAEATLAALKKMLAPAARVRRDGRVEEIGAAQLVPGDLVLLEAGDRVPADGRVLAAHNAEVDESALTGESHAGGQGRRGAGRGGFAARRSPQHGLHEHGGHARTARSCWSPPPAWPPRWGGWPACSPRRKPGPRRCRCSSTRSASAWP